MDNAPAVEMLGITKRFPGVPANDHVDFTARWGELHALIGENGAGKTTLMNILYGLHAPDSGEIHLSGEKAEISSPRNAIAMRIGMVHQHFMLVQAFTVLENVILGAEPASLGTTDYRVAERKLLDVCCRFDLQVEPRSKVTDLSVSAQQKVEILKALYRDARILILDEPTSVLAPQEAESLFGMLREMVSDGMCVILISHKLSDVMSYADRITVLRQGRRVASVETSHTTAEELTRLMVGDTAPSVGHRAGPPRRSAEPILTVSDLSVRGDSGLPAVGGIGFDIRSGEILGVAGVDGNGQRELAEALIGLRSASGSLSLDGREIIRWSVRQRLDAGLGYVPEDRRFALVPDDSILDNSILGAQRDRAYARHGVLNVRAAHAHASDLISRYDVRASGPEMPVRFLSGGNQQKLVLGRALCRQPRIMIVSQPTRGLDVNAAAEVRSHLLAERERGAGVLLISHDLDEILSLSDRILVMYRGRAAGMLSRDEADRECIGALMLGADEMTSDE